MYGHWQFSVLSHHPLVLLFAELLTLSASTYIEKEVSGPCRKSAVRLLILEWM